MTSLFFFSAAIVRVVLLLHSSRQLRSINKHNYQNIVIIQNCNKFAFFVEIELSDAQKELRSLIQKQLEEEVSKLRANMDEQLKVSDEGIQKKLAVAEGSSNRGSSKGGRKKK